MTISKQFRLADLLELYPDNLSLDQQAELRELVAQQEEENPASMWADDHII